MKNFRKLCLDFVHQISKVICFTLDLLPFQTVLFFSCLLLGRNGLSFYSIRISLFGLRRLHFYGRRFLLWLFLVALQIVFNHFVVVLNCLYAQRLWLFNLIIIQLHLRLIFYFNHCAVNILLIHHLLLWVLDLGWRLIL
jgi:hypothetical protein